MRRIIFVVIAALMLWNAAMAEETKPEGKQPEGKQDEKKATSQWFDAKKAKQPAPDEKNLEKYKDLVKTYQDYWQAFIKKDFKTTYETETPEYRKSISYDLYADRLKNSTIASVKPYYVKQKDEREVIVHGIYLYKFRLHDMAKSFDDTWIKEGDAFRHLRQEAGKAVDIKKLSETTKSGETKKASETKEVVK